MQAVRLSIAATFTSEPIGRWLEWWLARVGCCVEVTFAAYGQLERELRSPLAFRGAVSCIGLLRLSDWHRDDAFDASIMQAALDTFTDSVRVALANLPRLCLVLCPSRPSAHAAQYEVAAARLRALAAQEPRLCVVDASMAASSYGVLDVHDAVADELGHVPYAEPMWCALGAATARGCLAALAPPLKLIVVDCDYTLWHHAVGEVGAAGVRFEARHLELHRRLLQLHARGVLLALASRNVEADVWAALETAPATAPSTAPSTALATALATVLVEPSRLDERPPGVEAMAAALADGAAAAPPPVAPPPVAPPPVAPPPVALTSELRRLSRQHLSAYRIAPSLHKGAALAALCAELRCGPESCLFIDDNPSEVAAVRAAFPSCACWYVCRRPTLTACKQACNCSPRRPPPRCMPQTDAESRAQLAHVWRLDPDCCGTLSSDVATNVRAASLAAEGERHALRQASGSLSAYHEQLQVQIEIRHDVLRGEIEIRHDVLRGGGEGGGGEGGGGDGEGGEGGGGEGGGAETNRVALKSKTALEAALGELDTARVELDTALEERWRELHERTNQFNAWKRPLPPPAALRSHGLSALAVEVADRYSAYGLVGAALARVETADGSRGTLQVLSFCMSCRVLGRGVEHAMMRALGNLIAI